MFLVLAASDERHISWCVRVMVVQAGTQMHPHTHPRIASLNTGGPEADADQAGPLQAEAQQQEQRRNQRETVSVGGAEHIPSCTSAVCVMRFCLVNEHMHELVTASAPDTHVSCCALCTALMHMHHLCLCSSASVACVSASY